MRRKRKLPSTPKGNSGEVAPYKAASFRKDSNVLKSCNVPWKLNNIGGYKVDWSLLYFGKVERWEIQNAIDDAEWQRLRISMKGKPLQEKYSMLRAYYDEELCRLRLAGADESDEIRLLQVRVTNYVTALSRGGLIKVSAYRNCN